VAGTSRYLAWQRSPRNSEFQIDSEIHAVGDIVCRIPDRRGHNWSAFYGPAGTKCVHWKAITPNSWSRSPRRTTGRRFLFCSRSAGCRASPSERAARGLRSSRRAPSLRRWAQSSFRGKDLLLCQEFSRSWGASWSIRSPMCWAEDLPEQRANGVPRDDRNDDVRHKDSKNRQKSPTPSGQQRGGACRQAVLWLSSLMERAFHVACP